MARTRLTPLGKLVLLVGALTLAAVLGAAGASANRPYHREWACVEVRPGDTVWQLARLGGEGDVRAAVHRIVEHNGLAARVIHPGEALWVPRGGAEVSEVAAGRCPPIR